MLRGACKTHVPLSNVIGKKLSINTTAGHKIQVSQIKSSSTKHSFHVNISQKSDQNTIPSTPQSFRFCFQPSNASKLRNETPQEVFFVNRRYNSSDKEKTQDKENTTETTQEKQSTHQDKTNPLSTHYHTTLPLEKHSLDHMFEPIPKAMKMPSLWLFLVAIIVIKQVLAKQSEGIADDLVVLFHRYEEAQQSKDPDRILKAEADLVQFVNMGSLLFLMGNPKLSSPELVQEICKFILNNQTNQQITDLVLTLFTAVIHCSRSSLEQADLPLAELAARFSSNGALQELNVASSLSQAIDTLVIDGYDLKKIAAAKGFIGLVDAMAHHTDAAIVTRAAHVLRALAQNPETAPALQGSVPTLIHVIKRKDNEESVIYAKEAMQGLLAAGSQVPELKMKVEEQLYGGTAPKELANDIVKFERPISATKIPKITMELTLAVFIALGWGYFRWTRALKKRGVNAQDMQKIVKYRTALTAGTTAVAVAASILEDNVIAHHSEIASDVVAFIGWPLFLAVTPFIIVPSFLSAIVSAHTFDKICEEHRR